MPLQFNEMIVAISGISLGALFIIGMFILIGLKIIKGGKAARRTNKQSESEYMLLLEVAEGLATMERRVESLEVILVDRDRERKSI